MELTEFIGLQHTAGSIMPYSLQSETPTDKCRDFVPVHEQEAVTFLH